VQGETKEARWAGVVAIALGGALGALMRFGLAELFPVEPGAFPTTTFAENMIGCFGLGLVLTLLLERWRGLRYARPFLCIGLLGAFTTFSSFAVEADHLIDGGQAGLAFGYVLASVVGGVALALAGVVAARAVPPRLESAP
jgi:CrcB protein